MKKNMVKRVPLYLDSTHLDTCLAGMENADRAAEFAVPTSTGEDSAPTGRPIITMCVDLATRYPLAFYIDFEKSNDSSSSGADKGVVA